MLKGMNRKNYKEYTTWEWLANTTLVKMLEELGIGKTYKYRFDKVRVVKSDTSGSANKWLWVKLTMATGIRIECVVKMKTEGTECNNYAVESIDWTARINKSSALLSTGNWYPNRRVSFCTSCPTEITGQYHPAFCPDCGTPMSAPTIISPQ